MFIDMKAASCTKPGIDPAARRRGSARARARSGCCSNQSIGLLVASSLTLVGLTRVSIGPAISVMLRGCGGVAVCGHHRDGGQRLHAGLADRDDVRAGAHRLQET